MTGPGRVGSDRMMDELLLRELTPAVLGVLVRRGVDFATAEDAVQEALIQAALTWPDRQPADPKGWLKAMVDAGEIFHPLRWTPAEAMQLLQDVPLLETAGVMVRMPAAWRGSKPPRPRVTGVVGARPPGGVGQEALLDFQMEVTLDGERLTGEEMRELLSHSDGLALVRGKWV